MNNERAKALEGIGFSWVVRSAYNMSIEMKRVEASKSTGDLSKDEANEEIEESNEELFDEKNEEPDKTEKEYNEDTIEVTEKGTEETTKDETTTNDVEENQGDTEGTAGNKDIVDVEIECITPNDTDFNTNVDDTVIDFVPSSDNKTVIFNSMTQPKQLSVAQLFNLKRKSVKLSHLDEDYFPLGKKIRRNYDQLLSDSLNADCTKRYGGRDYNMLMSHFRRREVAATIVNLNEEEDEDLKDDDEAEMESEIEAEMDMETQNSEKDEAIKRLY